MVWMYDQECTTCTENSAHTRSPSMTRLPFAVTTLLLLLVGCGGNSGVAVEPVEGSTSEQDATTTIADPVEPDASPSNDAGVADPPMEAGQLEVSEAPDGPLPASPGNLSASRYSFSAGEIFWSPSAEAAAGTRYLVRLDGQVLATVSNFSYFIQTLSEGIAHEVSVTAISEQGRMSEPVVTLFNTEIDIPPPVFEFEMNVDRMRAAVDEGNTEGTTFVISVAPSGVEPISLSVSPQQAGDEGHLATVLGSDVLDRDNPQTTVNFQLSVGMRPLQPHERRFNVVATSGEEVRRAELILDVKPTSAPDVYLLIGQSNMVGSSESGAKQVTGGGLDERNNRIWQLNVAPNTRSVFVGPADFTNESSTAIEPRFIEAEDPLHDPRNPIVIFKGGTSVGPGLSFAKAALPDTTSRIYLVPAAWGATGFCQSIGFDFGWNARKTDNSALAGTSLLDRALTRLNLTLRDTGGVLRGILWHQGGADSNNRACADSYSQNLQLMVERLRREAREDIRGSGARGSNAPIPFLVATQSRGSDERGDFSNWPDTKVKVDAVQRNISGIVPFADWVNNDDLVPPAFPCGSSSCVHFGATANREIGNRFYRALTRVWDRGN